MTISGIMARFLVEEHKYSPLPKEIHLLGRQTILLTLDATRTIFEEVGVNPKEARIEFDTSTRQASSDGTNPSDTSFFEMFGVERVRAIDHSDFEGADIVFDLTKELPPQHEASADFIFDGSVMDNVFDPSYAMRNVARLLRPGGRYIGTNAASVRWLPAYVAFNPYWFFDFFVANGFRDVKIYVIDYGDRFQQMTNWANAEIHLLDAHADHRNVHNFPISTGPAALAIIAEKGEDSTWNEQTSQGVYRLDDEWKDFDAKLARVQASKRPVPKLQRQADAGGGNGFTYVGVLNERGLSYRSFSEPFPPFEGGVIEVGKPFAGYNWGTPEAHAGKTWRWIDDLSDQSVLLVNLPPDREFRMEATVHTAKDTEAIKALRATVNGVKVPGQKVTYNLRDHKLVATIPRSTGRAAGRPLYIGFSAREGLSDPSPEGRNVALSQVRFTRGR